MHPSSAIAIQYLTFQKQFDLLLFDNVGTSCILMFVPISIIFLRHLIFLNRPCEGLREMVSQLWILGASHLYHCVAAFDRSSDAAYCASCYQLHFIQLKRSF
jgi:hypothetical protein